MENIYTAQTNAGEPAKLTDEQLEAILAQASKDGAEVLVTTDEVEETDADKVGPETSIN